MSPSLASWIVVAVALIVAETVVVYLLRGVTPEISAGVVYLVGVLAVFSVWALGVVTAMLSAAAIELSYLPPPEDFVVPDLHGAVAPTFVLAVAVVICSVAAPTRSLSIGTDERRAAVLRRDGGTLLVPADPLTTERRVRQRVVASRDGEGMASAGER
jgi:K+-sensing histidine kinase KdpD